MTLYPCHLQKPKIHFGAFSMNIMFSFTSWNKTCHLNNLRWLGDKSGNDKVKKLSKSCCCINLIPSFHPWPLSLWLIDTRPKVCAYYFFLRWNGEVGYPWKIMCHIPISIKKNPKASKMYLSLQIDIKEGASHFVGYVCKGWLLAKK